MAIDGGGCTQFGAGTQGRARTPSRQVRRGPRNAVERHRPNFLARLFDPKLRADGGWTYGGGYGYGRYGSRDTPYTGASWIRKQLSNWLPIRAAADAELLSDMGTLVARSRRLRPQHRHRRRRVSNLTDNVIGVGLRLSCWPDYRALGKDADWAESWGRNVESLWKSWSEKPACDVANKLNFTGLTTLIYRSVLQNGEALALPLSIDRPDLNQFKTCLQLVDPDRLSNPGNMTPTLCLRGGVKINDYGNRWLTTSARFPLGRRCSFRLSAASRASGSASPPRPTGAAGA